MATITGLTAERMQEMEDETIIGGLVVGDDLILSRRDGTPINAGNVKGPAGPPGPPGGIVGGYTEPLDDRGNVSGAVSLNFGTHNIWRIVPTAAVTISFLGLPSVGNVAPGTLIIANSFHAITWPVGTKFPKGAPPTLSGETFLSLFARSTHVTVGVAWAGVA